MRPYGMASTRRNSAETHRHHPMDNSIGKAFGKAAKYVVTRGAGPLPWE